MIASLLNSADRQAIYCYKCKTKYRKLLKYTVVSFYWREGERDVLHSLPLPRILFPFLLFNKAERWMKYKTGNFV